MNTILAPIDDIVAWIITGIYHLLSPVFGVTSGATWVLTIVLLTVLMRLILVPLFVKQMHTQRAMTALTPQLTELRKKYKGDREKLNAETMKVYQEAGVNPMMGCLPVVLQMPIFFALFSVLRYIAEFKSLPHGQQPSYHLAVTTIQSAQHAQIFGVSINDTFLHGTSVHVHVVVALVVATSMATTYLTMRQNVKRGIMPTGKDNPMGQSQQMMTYILPLFALTGLYWPFGLVLYWVSTNVWTLGQQYVMLRKYPVGAALPPGGLPIKGSSGRPAAASGLTGTTPGRPKLARPGAAGGSPAKPKSKQPTEVSDSTTSPELTDKATGSGVQDARPSDGESAAPPNGQAPADRKAKPGVVSKGTASKSESGARARPSGQPAAGGSGGRDDQSRPAPAGSANGHKPAGDGGKLRRIGRGRAAEPEAQVPAEPEVKIVRQQPKQQSRSKRSGKR